MLISLSQTPLRLDVSFCGPWVPRPQDEYVLRELLSGQRLGGGRGSALRASVSLQPLGVALVYAEARADREGCTARAQALRRQLEALEKRGFLTDYLAAERERMERALSGGRWAKAAAFVDCLEAQLGLRVRAHGREVNVTVRELEGTPVEDTQVWAELVPVVGGNLAPLREVGGGLYTLTLDESHLGEMYDYVNHAYVPFSGPLRVNLFARKGAGRGQQSVYLNVGG